MKWIAYANKANAVGLKVFFSFLLILVLAAGFYIIRNREAFFGHKGREGDTYASANLRMWLIILVWIHAVVITTLMIFEV
ncbi:MAG: hypothetical protein M3032_04770 [Verrucomicrobiota bacterium]|nr:hypothetical protein [Verrucomicrobiota bacterium]